MVNSIHKITKTLILLLVFNLLLISSAFAIENNADAIYRSGGLGNDWDHAGVYAPNTMVYEIKGINQTVGLYSLSSFKVDASYTYFGPYYQSWVDSSTKKQYILNTCSALDAAPGLTYTALGQAYTFGNPGTRVDVADLSDIRCDGVVEYSYEDNGFYVWGPSDTLTRYGAPWHYLITTPSFLAAHQTLIRDQPWSGISPYGQRGAMYPTWTMLTKRY